MTIRNPAGPYIPTLDFIRFDPFQVEAVKIKSYAVCFTRIRAGKAVGNFESGYPVSFHIADFPDHMVPTVILQNDGSLALLAKQCRQFFCSVIKKLQVQRRGIESGQVRPDPERKTVKLSPVLPVKLPPESGAAPATPVLRSRSRKPHRRPQQQGIISVVYLLCGKH